MSDGRLRKREKLMEKTDFERVLKKGGRFYSRNFSVIAAENGLGFARIGKIVAKKKVPRAVSRNKIKRRFREVFRLNKQMFGSRDVVFMAQRDSSNLPFKAVSGDILRLVSRGS